MGFEGENMEHIEYVKKDFQEKTIVRVGSDDKSSWHCQCWYDKFKLENDYSTKGLVFGINNIKRIKLRFCHRSFSQECSKKSFCIFVYANTSCNSSNFEFSFKVNLCDYYLKFNDITRDVIKTRFAKNLNRVKMTERKLLATNERFVDYIYDKAREVIEELNHMYIYNFGV